MAHVLSPSPHLDIARYKLAWHVLVSVTAQSPMPRSRGGAAPRPRPPAAASRQQAAPARSHAPPPAAPGAFVLASTALALTVHDCRRLSRILRRICVVPVPRRHATSYLSFLRRNGVDMNHITHRLIPCNCQTALIILLANSSCLPAMLAPPAAHQHAPPPAMPQSGGGGGMLSGLMGTVAQGEGTACASAAACASMALQQPVVPVHRQRTCPCMYALSTCACCRSALHRCCSWHGERACTPCC